MDYNLKLYTTRPEDERLPKETAVYDLLEKLDIPYARVDHEAVPTIEACREIDRVLGIRICKNLFLCNQQKTRFYLLLMPGEKKFVTKELSKQIQSARLSFAKENFLEEFLNLTPGSVTVLGLMNDKDSRVQLLIDKDVLDQEYIGCHPCINTSSLKLRMRDLTEKFLPCVKHDYTVVDL